MSLSFNITNPGLNFDGILTSQESQYVTDLVLAGGTASEDEVLTWKSGAPSWEPAAAVGGYTNLTQFVGQTAWRVFYSNDLGDVTELALGADGTYLKSNGAAVAPSFATPAGSGDVSKVGTPVDNQVGVWTGAGTIEGDAGFTFDGGLGITVADTENKVGLTVTQNDTTNNPTAVLVTNAGSNPGIKVVNSAVLGVSGRGIESRLSAAQNQATSAAGFFAVDNASSTSTPAIYGIQAGTGDGLFMDTNNAARGIFVDKDVTNANAALPAIQIDTTAVVTDAGTYTKTGAALQINSNVTETSGTITDSAQVLDINQTHADATGNVVDIGNSGNGKSIEITAGGNNDGLLLNKTGAMTGSTAAIRVFSDTVQTNSPIGQFRHGNVSSSTDVLAIEQLGTGKGIFVNNDNTGRSIDIDHDANSASAITGLWVNTANAGAGAAYAAIFEAGNVGIGDTSPDELLSVIKDSTDSFVRVGGSSTNEVGIKFSHGGVEFPIPKTAIIAKGTGTFRKADLHFVLDSVSDANPANTTDDTKMIILNNGRVGIGTTTPTVPLDVVGAAAVSGGIALPVSQSISFDTTETISSDGSAMRFGVNSGLQMRIDSGKVTIGKDDIGPSGKLNVFNTTDSASVQTLTLQGDRATPTAGDNVYQSFYLSDSAGNQDEFARITAQAIDVTSTTEDGELYFGVTVGGTLTNKLKLDGTNLRPNANDGTALGAATNSFSDLFLAEGGVINWDNGDATLTQVGDVVTLAGADLKVSSPGTASTSVATIDGTQTLTNKRVTKRTGTTTSHATPTINTDNVDEYYITAQTEAITSFTTNLSGTPTLGQTLFISVIGTAARAITWGASFANGPVALPTTTVTTTQLSTLLKWDGSIWRCYATGSTV